MSGDADLLAPVQPDQTPPPQDAAPPVTPEPDEPDVIEIPTGEKLVPLSALTNDKGTGARDLLKATKAELASLKEQAGKSAEKDAKIQQLEQQIQQLSPLAQAYQAAVEAQSRQPQVPAEPTPQQTAKLQKVAQQLDFYKSDGQLDLDRAKAHLDLLREEAAEIARQQVEPYEQMTTAQRSGFMLERALITEAPDGTQPDPDVLRTVWARLDKKLTADPKGAAQAFSIALGHSALVGKLKGKAPAQEVIPPPLETEPAGGKVTQIHLRESDKRAAKDLEMSEKEYADMLKQMPDGWGKGQ